MYYMFKVKCMYRGSVRLLELRDIFFRKEIHHIFSNSKILYKLIYKQSDG